MNLSAWSIRYGVEGAFVGSSRDMHAAKLPSDGLADLAVMREQAEYQRELTRGERGH